jgi:hypothetical protein
LKEEKGSLWNRTSIRSRVGVWVSNWFDDNLYGEVGDDTYTLFWCVPWLYAGVLKDIFNRLFTLANNKMATVRYFQFRLRGWWWDSKMATTFLGLGGRIIEGDVAHYFILLFCCLMLVTCRSDSFLNLQNIMFHVLITTCLQWTNIPLIIQISFGIRMSH